MKRLVLILASLLVGMISMGQSVEYVKNNFDFTLDPAANLTYKYYVGTTADTISATDSLWNYDIAVQNLLKKLDSNVKVKLDSVSGSPSVTVTLQGKWSYTDSYTNITAVTWAGTSSDTTFTISNTTNKDYRFYNILFDATATAQKSKVNYIEFGISED